MESVTVTSVNGAQKIDIVDQPDRCPFCHKYISPNYVNGFKNYNYAWIGFQCPSCEMFFTASYTPEKDSYNKWIWIKMKNTFRGNFENRQFSDTIAVLSPDFLNIFGQAEHGEAEGLDLICGIGYRKSLEFLIKDYCISKNQTEKENIEKMPLMQVVEKFVDDQKVKDMAKRAVWLGNDETHYVRTWKDHDLKSLKILINLTIHWIEFEGLTNEYIQLMPSPVKVKP